MTAIKLAMSDPIINTFNIYGNITSIIPDKYCLPWIYNNFIQIRYVYDWDTYFFDHHHLLLDNCPWLDHHVVPKHYLIKKWDSIHDFIIESINLGYYLYFYVDRYHISISSSFKKKKHWHEIFIYGYDSDCKKYFVADNLVDGKYIRTECSFDEIEKGYLSIDSDNQFFLNMHLLSKKQEEEYSFNLSQVIQSLKNYIYSSITVDVSFKEKVAFGIDALILAAKKESISSIEKITFDRRAFHLFWEHKKIMLNRLKFMEEELGIQNLGNEIKQYKNIVDSFEVLRNMVLKFNLKKDKDLLLSIEKVLLNNVENEVDILEDIIGKF